MVIERREFLRLMGVAAGAAGLAGCDRFWAVPDRVLEMALRGPGLESWAQTVCGLCEGGCGLSVRLVDGIPVGLKGNPRHPLNRGGLCPVGQAGLDVLYAPNRIQGPLRRSDDGVHVSATWDEVLDAITQRIQTIRSRGGGSGIVFLNGEPGRLREDLIRHFMDALGSSDYACPKDPVAPAYRLTQGLDHPPGLDLGGADLVVSFGQDLFEDGPAPLHAVSAMIGARPDGEKADLIYVGTRLSPTASNARFRVHVRPATHGAFALGVAQVLVREGRYDLQFVTDHTFGFDDFTDGGGTRRTGFRTLLVERYYPDRVAQICGCEASAIVEVARRLGSAVSPLALIGSEAVAESNGTWNAMAVHGLNALTGAFNRPGGIVLPPPAPLAPMPTLSTDNRSDPGESLFAGGGEHAWGDPDPIEALVDGVMEGPRPIELLFVSGWNPVFESPAGRRLREALDRIPTIVALSPFLDETSELADFVLPTSVFLESWECTTTPSTVPYATLGVGSPVLGPLFDTRSAGDVVLELGRRIDSTSPAFSQWADYQDFIHQRLEGLAVAGQGSVFKGPVEEAWAQFLEERGWRFMEYTEFGTLWADLVNHGGWWNPSIPTVAWSQMFRTPSGRFEFWPQLLERKLEELGSTQAGSGENAEGALVRGLAAAGLDDEEGAGCLPHFEPPLSLGDGEVRLMTFRPITARGRLGVSSAMLLEMFGHHHLSGWETWAELNPDTARELGLGDGDIVALESEAGTARVVVRLQPGGTPGLVHVPLGLGHSGGIGPSAGVGSNPVELLPIIRDSLSGSLALNGLQARLRLLRRRPHGGPAPTHGAHSP